MAPVATSHDSQSAKQMPVSATCQSSPGMRIGASLSGSAARASGIANIARSAAVTKSPRFFMGFLRSGCSGDVVVSRVKHPTATQPPKTSRPDRRPIRPPHGEPEAGGIGEGEFFGQVLIEVHAPAGLFADVHVAVFHGGAAGEHVAGLAVEVDGFLNAEVVDGQVEVGVA